MAHVHVVGGVSTHWGLELYFVRLEFNIITHVIWPSESEYDIKINLESPKNRKTRIRFFNFKRRRPKVVSFESSCQVLSIDTSHAYGCNRKNFEFFYEPFSKFQTIKSCKYAHLIIFLPDTTHIG